jgi:predicted Zn-dependent protease with MMP-like domain
VPLARLLPGRPGRHGVPPRIVLYRRPLLARADGEEDLGELVLDVVIEEFARLLGVDPSAVDPGYSAED